MSIKAKPLACPWCGAPISRVLESRVEPANLKDQLTYSGDGFWRKRRCLTCAGTFTTEEVVAAKLDPPEKI